MASDPHKIIRNDNLRLVLSAQEGDYIRESRRKMRRQALLKSIFAVLCAVMICSGLVVGRIDAALFDDYRNWFSGAFFLGIVLAPIAVLSVVSSYLSLYRYKNMKREHNDFLAGYGRKHSD